MKVYLNFCGWTENVLSIDSMIVSLDYEKGNLTSFVSSALITWLIDAITTFDIVAW